MRPLDLHVDLEPVLPEVMLRCYPAYVVVPIHVRLQLALARSYGVKAWEEEELRQMRKFLRIT